MMKKIPTKIKAFIYMFQTNSSFSYSLAHISIKKERSYFDKRYPLFSTEKLNELGLSELLELEPGPDGVLYKTDLIPMKYAFIFSFDNNDYPEELSEIITEKQNIDDCLELVNSQLELIKDGLSEEEIDILKPYITKTINYIYEVLFIDEKTEKTKKDNSSIKKLIEQTDKFLDLN